MQLGAQQQGAGLHFAGIDVGGRAGGDVESVLGGVEGAVDVAFALAGQRQMQPVLSDVGLKGAQGLKTSAA
jgi:hypothetical protein